MTRSRSQIRRQPRFPHLSRGVSLIESLVSIVLLGMAVPHAQSFKFSAGSYTRTQVGNLYMATVNWSEMSIRKEGNDQKGVSFTFQPATVSSVL